MDNGVDNLVNQFHLMWQNEWENQHHVFQLALCNLNHAIGNDLNSDQATAIPPTSTHSDHEGDEGNNSPNQREINGCAVISLLTTECITRKRSCTL